jgi:hypothetical protein
MRTGHKQGGMQLFAFTCRLKIGTAPSHKTGKGRTAASPKLCSEKQERGFLLLKCHAPPLWFHPVCCYKRPLKEEEGLLPFGALLWAFGLLDFLLWAFCFGGLFAFEYWEEAFTLGLLVWEAFGRDKNY